MGRDSPSIKPLRSVVTFNAKGLFLKIDSYDFVLFCDLGYLLAAILPPRLELGSSNNLLAFARV